MQAFDDYYFLGKIIKPHGFDGKVNTYLDTDEPALYSNLDMVFLNMNGLPVPFFIETIILKNNKATIKFRDVNTLEQSTLLIQKEMYLPLSTLPALSGNKFYFHEVIGFTVTDKKSGEIGIVKQVLEYPNQAVLQVIHNDKEVLIPANKGVIKLVDRSKKRIEIEAPEGLLEVYLH